jgi:hypothetical protein
VSNVSGKLVIIGVMIVAVTAAGTSWWIRYNSTHRAAEFWGPTAVRRIRDAPFVQLFYVNDDPDLLSDVRNISNTPGLTHLRHALLEDRSFKWPARRVVRQPRWRWAIGFGDKKWENMILVLFTEDWKQATMLGSETSEIVSSEPIADAMAIMFPELSRQNVQQR